MSRIYIGNLPLDIRESELDDLFYKYGKIREIDLKTPARPPAFAFISFDDHRDAEDAIRGRDNYNYDGYRLRVEFAKGNGRGGGGRIDDRRDAPRRGGGGGRRSDHGVLVSNLPRGCSWQDLKDFMRKAGDVIYTDVDKYGDGVVEFSNRDDMEYALRTLDDTEFKNYNESSYIRVKPRKDGGRGRSEDRHGGSGRASSKDRRRSPSPRRSRSRSPSPRRSRSRSPSPRRSRSPSPRRSPSRSRSRSRDRLGDKRDGGSASDDEGGRKKSRADGDEDDAPRGDSADDKSAKEEED